MRWLLAWTEGAGQDPCVEVVARRSGAERMKALVWWAGVAQEQRMKVLVRRECVVQEK